MYKEIIYMLNVLLKYQIASTVCCNLHEYTVVKTEKMYLPWRKNKYIYSVFKFASII